MSAIFGSLTVAFVCMIVSRLTRNQLAALLVSLILAFSFTFWSVCLVAEVYTLTFFLVCATVYCLIRWRETMRRSWFYLACLVYALSFNHPMVIVLIPSFLFIVLSTDRGIFRSWRALVTIGLIILLGASQYLFILLRSYQSPVYCEGAISNLKELFWFVTGASYKRHYFAYNFNQVLTICLPGYIRILISQFTLPGLLLAIIGSVVFFLRERIWAIFFALLYVTTVALYINGPHIEQPIYFIPATIVITIAMGFITAPYKGRNLGSIVASLVLIAVLFKILIGNFSLVDLGGKNEYDGMADRVLSAVSTDSIILSPDYNWSEILLYKLLGEGSRAGDGVFVLHHWSPKELNNYRQALVPNWDPYRPREQLPDKFNIYLLTTKGDSRALKRVKSAGWRAIPVIELEPPLIGELRSMDEDKILLAAAKDEGVPIFSFEAFEAVSALGLRAHRARGDTSGWAAADAVVRYDGKWRGWQHFRFAPVAIRAEKGERIIRAPYVYPANIEILSAGYGRGSLNEIYLNGKKISTSDKGLNLAVIDRTSGELEKTINIAPADLDSLLSLYLYKLVPGKRWGL